MKEIHFYSSKTKGLLMGVISAIFILIFLNKDLGNEGLGIIIMYYLGFLLFSFVLAYSILLLFRTKPLLTVTDQHIIIYDLLIKPKTIKFEDTLSFYISNTTFRGIKTGEHIHIILKNDMKTFTKANYIINTDILNLKKNILLEILNTKQKAIIDKKVQIIEEIKNKAIT